MTRNPANSADADDSWEQLEADLFGIEVGKEHTAAERVASEPAPEPHQPVIAAVPKPLEEDDFGDFGDFGSGLVETPAAPPPRQSTAGRSRPKPTKPAPAAAVEPEPVKPLTTEPARAFKLSDLDDGPTDEELDAASDDDEAADEGAAATAPEDDPYWDALANWNWQEEDRSGKSKPDAGRDRPRSGGRSDSGPRESRGRSGERRPAPSRESRPAATEDRGHPTSRRPAPDRERSRVDEVPGSVSASAEAQREPREVDVEEGAAQPDVKARRQDRRRSRRQPHAAPATEESVIDLERLDETADDSWPDAVGSTRSTPSELPRSRAVPVAADDDDFEDDTVEDAEGSSEAAGEDDRGPRRRRRRRRRRPDRLPSQASESAADEDIKHLEDDAFGVGDDDELEEQSATEEPAAEEDEDRPSRARRPRRRRRGARTDRPDRPERPARAPVARVEPEFDDEEEEEDEDVELVDAEGDDEFDEDHDREFVEDDTPARSHRRPSRSRRSSSDRPFVRPVEDEDEEDSEPEPAVSYEDVPSWEEAISYLLNPSTVEGAAASSDRGERSSSGDRGQRGGERSSRPPRRGPRRDA